MKQKFKNVEELHQSCVKDGYIKEILAVNKEKIRALLKNSSIAVDSADSLAKMLKEEDEKWLTVYILYYDALRMNTEAFLLFDKIISLNHQCVFAALCLKHSELEFDWKFFEKIRHKRNGANYYGEKIVFADWKEDQSQFKRYIVALKKEIEMKLGSTA